MKKYITPAMILSWSPCSEYNEARIRSLFGTQERATVTDILKAPIPLRDALWVVLREELIPPKTLRLFGCACAYRTLKRERAAGREPDGRSWYAVKTARRYAMGKATVEELEMAWAAAGAAVWAAAAAGTPAWAARAAREAEGGWQKRKLLSMLKTRRTSSAGRRGAGRA